MAGNNQLSDVDLEIRSSELQDLSSKWSSDVLNVGLSSLNIKGAFSALIEQGIGSQYIESLENAIKQAEKNALNISKIIAETVSDQDQADQSAANQSNQNNYNYYVKRNGDGGSNADTGNYGNKENGDAAINPGNETKEKELSSDEVLKIVIEFQSINTGNTYEMAFNKEYASKVKEQLLASPNLSKETKEILAELEPSVIQTNLQNILLSGETIEGFSKLVITIFNQNFQKRVKNASLLDISTNLSEVYSKLSKEDNYQEDLYKIYTGDVSKEVEDETIYFTRDLVDTVAAASDATYEDVLKDSKYKEALKMTIDDLSTTFDILRGAKDCDSAVSSKLCSSLIVKDKGNGVYA